MNHNKFNLQEGEHVILDKDFNNTSEVVIFKFTPNEMIATVYSAIESGDMWQVMTNRLTKLQNE